MTGIEHGVISFFTYAVLICSLGSRGVMAHIISRYEGYVIGIGMNYWDGPMEGSAMGRLKSLSI